MYDDILKKMVPLYKSEQDEFKAIIDEAVDLIGFGAGKQCKDKADATKQVCNMISNMQMDEMKDDFAKRKEGWSADHIKKITEQELAGEAKPEQVKKASPSDFEKAEAESLKNMTDESNALKHLHNQVRQNKKYDPEMVKMSLKMWYPQYVGREDEFLDRLKTNIDVEDNEQSILANEMGIKEDST